MFKKRVYFEIITTCTQICINNLTCAKIGLVHKFSLSFIVTFYLKSCSPITLFKRCPQEGFVNFCFHSFPCRFFTDIKNRFHCLKCFSQVAAECTKNKLQLKKNNVMCS